MWSNQLNLVPVGEATDKSTGRTLEIFLDLLVAIATDSRSYLLAEGCEQALADAEKTLRGKLQHLNSFLSDDETQSSGGVRLREMLA